MQINRFRRLLYVTLLFFVFGCTPPEEGGVENQIPASTLKEGDYNASANSFDFTFSPQSVAAVIDAPSNTDYSRGAMAHDGVKENLFYFREGSSDTFLYWFQRDTSIEVDPNAEVDPITFEGAEVNVYKLHENRPMITLPSPAADIDRRYFSTVYDGASYKLFFLSRTELKLYQFIYNDVERGFILEEGEPEIPIRLAPADINMNRWALVVDDYSGSCPSDGFTAYILYIAKGNTNEFYSFRLFQNCTDENDVGFDFLSTAPRLKFNNLPPSILQDNPMLLHDKSGNLQAFFTRSLSEAGNDDGVVFVDWLRDYINGRL